MPAEAGGSEVLAAKKAGTAGVETVEMLELCVQCPASVLRALLDSMTAGASAACLSQLAQRVQGALDADGAGERGLLLVYNDLLESPGLSVAPPPPARARAARCGPASGR